eukprot:196166_1
MSASRVYNMLLKPAVFQPVGLFSFGLIGYIWIDRKINAMNTSVNEAINTLNATGGGSGSGSGSSGDVKVPNNLIKRLNELESRLTALKASIPPSTRIISSSNSDASSGNLEDLIQEINEIKSMTDLNMFDIQENFDKLNGEINDIKATSDDNISDIETEFNILKSNICDIKMVCDTNMSEIENELSKMKSKIKKIEFSNDNDGIYDTLNKLEIQIELIKEIGDENMGEIENNLKRLTSKFMQYENNFQEHYDALMVAEEAFNTLDEKQQNMTCECDNGKMENVMNKQNQMIGRLQEMEEKVHEHRNAFNVAENALNDLISWKNEVVYK